MMMRMGAVALSLAALLAGQEARAADACTVKAGPVWSNKDAQDKCPSTCHDKGYAGWTGEWNTTVPGKMSVCRCKDKLTTVEAGPLWNDEDARNKCPTTCKDKGHTSWTGQWWTTVWGKMSVCQCGSSCL